MHYLAILCLISTVAAGPGWPAVIEVREGPSYHQREAFPRHPKYLYSQDAFGLEDRIGEEFLSTKDEADQGGLVGSSRPSVVIHGIQEQLMEDLLRMEQDLLLIRRLLGQGPLSVPRDSRPPVFPSSPWALPVLPPTRYNPWGDEEESQRPTFSHDSPWFHFPGLGFDRPIFPDIPGVPSGGEVPQVDELPDNYDNSTYKVHLINGSRVEVNTTTNKKSGDGFNSFFHHQVIHIRPDQDRVWEQPGDQGSTTPFPVDTTQGEEEEEEEESVVPVVPEVEKRVIPMLPEVENEVQSSRVTELPTRAEVATEGREKEWVSRRDAGRLLSGSNRRAAAYVIKSVESEEDYKEDEELREPDLSSDTLVNHVGSDQQGMTLVEPEAEVFNLGLVLKEAETSIRD